MFKTKDIDAAAFLAYHGHKPLGIRKTDHPKVKEFEFDDAAFETLKLFYKEDQTVQVQKYLGKRTFLKFTPLTE